MLKWAHITLQNLDIKTNPRLEVMECGVPTCRKSLSIKISATPLAVIVLLTSR